MESVDVESVDVESVDVKSPSSLKRPISIEKRLHIRCLSVLCLVLLSAALPASAHHSFPAQYDIDKPITLTVKVTRVEWTNPHIFIYGDVGAGTSDVASWMFEMGGPNALIRKGWKRDSLKPDDIIIIEGSLARDGSKLVNARTVTMEATGRKMFAGSSGGDEVP